jgi:hypothetical protein
MTKGIGTPENRETAYRVFALFGGRNIKQILGRLQWKHDIEISAQTLYEWKKEGQWEERMARTAGTDVLTFNEQMLGRVLRLIRRYDVHFAGGPVNNAQAAYAYTNLIRTAMELARRMNRWESAEPPSPGTLASETPASEAEARATDEEGHMTVLEDGIFFRDRENAGASQ